MSTHTLSIRRGRDTDLSAVMDIWYANETVDDPQPPPRPAMLPEYPHLLDTGELWVAEQAGTLVGFSGVVRRGNTAFLTDLFVDPQHQSGGVGTLLLQQAMAQYADLVRFTVSSTDPRAIALYTRAGMQPHWPHFLLKGYDRASAVSEQAGLTIRLADRRDPELVDWDAAASGRERPQDLAHWFAHEAGEPLWILHGTQRVGYAVVRLQSGTLWNAHAARIGPMGVRSVEYAASAVMAVVGWAAQRAKGIRIDLLGAHPGLAPLLAAGFRISYVETFMCSGEPTIFDPRCYSGSGGALF